MLGRTKKIIIQELNVELNLKKKREKKNSSLTFENPK